jgi:crossover junction endodeoxyribonuclease RuvC
MGQLKLFLGIDPGNTGAVCVIETVAGKIDAISFFDTPVLRVEGKEKTHTFLDAKQCAYILSLSTSGSDCKVFLEKVSAMPGSDGKGGRQTIGATSAFNFGMGYGVWIGICAGLILDIELVTPQAWKKTFSLVGQEKDAARLLAIQLFPQLEAKLARKKDIGRADALLLAYHGMLKSL